MRSLKTGRNKICRLTQPLSLSCRNAEISFSDREQTVKIYFYTLMKRTHLTVKSCPSTFTWFPRHGEVSQQNRFPLSYFPTLLQALYSKITRYHMLKSPYIKGQLLHCLHPLKCYFLIKCSEGSLS